MKTKLEQKPLARKEGLVIHELPDEVLVYDRESDRAHCLNQTAAYVWRRCDGKRSPAQIARSLSRDFGAEIDEQIVWFALTELARHRLLKHRPATPAFVSALSRRSMMKTLGITAAVAVPLVTSILAPTVQAVASCAPPGAACDGLNGPQCCSGSCSSLTGPGTCPSSPPA